MIRFTLSSLSLALLLAGCGGGGDSDGDGGASLSTTAYDVVAIDGYLRNAEIWLDLNNNMQLDANEPHAITGAEGKATLDIPAGVTASAHPVLVKAIAGETVDEENNKTVSADYLLAAPAGESVVTPLSTFVYVQVQAHSDMDVAAATSIVATSLGIPEADVLGDFIKEDNSEAKIAATNAVAAGLMPEDAIEIIADIDDPADLEQKTEALGEALDDVENGELLTPSLNPDGELIYIPSPDIDRDGVPDKIDDLIGSPSSVYKSYVLATGNTTCPNGGVVIDSGIDVNGNGRLDNDEVLDSQTICHGQNGQNGYNSLNKVTFGASDSICPTGVIRFDTGLDLNRDNVLDDDEISATETICIDDTANNPNPNPDPEPDPNPEPTPEGTDAISFKLGNAIQLVTSEQSAIQVSEPEVQAKSASAVWGESQPKRLNQFYFIEADNAEAKTQALAGISHAKLGMSSAKASAGSEVSSNFFTLDENGNTSFAADSEYSYKVSYSVVGPQEEFVYVAVDVDNFWESQDLVRATKCAIFKVSLTDPEQDWSCLEYGYAAQNINDSYRKTVSNSKLKPIQFDAQGNVLYLARELNIETEQRDTYREDGSPILDTDGNPVQEEYVTHVELDWEGSAQIRKVSTNAEGDSVGGYLTADDVHINSFIVMENNSMVYDYWSNTGNGLRIVTDLDKEVQATSELGGSNWGGEYFYATDDYNTVMYYQNYGNSGLQFVQPSIRYPGGRDKVQLDTSAFSSNDWDPTPKRVFLADDGYVYGLFVDSNWAEGSDTGNLYRMLPYSLASKATIDMGTDWWSYMDRREPQISKGYVYFIEEKQHSGYGSRDVIRAVRMVNNESTTLLGDSDWEKRYDISNWKLSNDKIYFTGFEQASSRMISGTIDTLKMKQGEPESEYLIVTETASVNGASIVIDDMEVIQPSAPNNNTGGNPRITQFYTDPENTSSASVEFSKWMDYASVNEDLRVTTQDKTTEEEIEVNNMKVWLGRNVHMIFDLNISPESLTTERLEYDTDYKILVGENSLDQEGYGLLDGMNGDMSSLTREFTTRPAEGMYQGQAAPLQGITDGAVAKLAMDPNSGSSNYRLNLGEYSNLNHRVEFSAPAQLAGNIRLLMQDANTVDWSNVTSVIKDGNDITWQWQDGFQYDSDGNRYTEEYLYDDQGNYTRSMFVEYVDAKGSVTESVQYDHVPYHYVDLDGEQYVDYYQSGEWGYKSISTGEIYTYQDGYYLDQTSETEYRWSFGAYRDDAGNEWDDSAELNLVWFDGGYYDSNDIRHDLNLEHVSEYYIDSEEQKVSLPVLEWHNGFYFGDVNSDGDIDHRQLDIYTDAEAGVEPEVYTEWQSDWNWANDFAEDDFIPTENGHMLASTQFGGGWNWSHDRIELRTAEDQEWINTNTYTERSDYAKGNTWGKHTITIVDNQDSETFTVTYSVVDADGKVLSTIVHDDAQIAFNEVSGTFRLSLELGNGEVELDNVKLFDITDGNDNELYSEDFSNNVETIFTQQ